jgi:hypothetical protein
MSRCPNEKCDGSGFVSRGGGWAGYEDEECICRKDKKMTQPKKVGNVKVSKTTTELPSVETLGNPQSETEKFFADFLCMYITQCVSDAAYAINDSLKDDEITQVTFKFKNLKDQVLSFVVSKEGIKPVIEKV